MNVKSKPNVLLNASMYTVMFPGFAS